MSTKNTYQGKFDDILDQVKANTGCETRATSVQHRILQMYREAQTANDLGAVKSITEEWGRREVALGQLIAQGSQPQAQAQQGQTQAAVSSGRIG